MNITREKLKSIGAISLFISLFCVAMYFNFRTKQTPAESEETTTFNTSVTDPTTSEINGSKLQHTPRERAQQQVEVAHTEAVKAQQSAKTTVQEFYNRPTIDHEKIRMQAEIEELKAQMKRQELPPTDPSAEDQLAIIERSYELAAKYSAKTSPPIPTPNKKEQTRAMSQAVNSVVSSLSPIEKADFTTAVGGEIPTDRNTITACIESDQTIVNSGAVKIRLLETMVIGDYKLDNGAVITGQSRVSGERLTIKISQVESRGRIIPIDLKILDSDGSEGIFIPNSTEVGALKQIVANMGSDTESSLSISTQSVGAEILADIGEGVIQGVSSYAQKKVQEVKVHLKAGYNVMLYQGE